MPRLNEDQHALAESAADVLTSMAGHERFRQLRDQGHTQDLELWAQLVELGWPAIVFPEDQGGLGWDLPELTVVMEALGQHMALTPLLSTLLGGRLDPESGAIDGRIVALAWEEGRQSHGLDLSQSTAQVVDGQLRGEKGRVLDGMVADSFVVLASEADEPGLYRVTASDAVRTPLHRLDSRDAAMVRFDRAPAERLSTSIEDLEHILDQATVALAAEMLGGAQAALDDTVAYLKERVQFDVPIGSFQVLQHRVVDCYIAIELARASVHTAARDPSPLLSSLAKTRCNEAYLAVAKEAIQMHGGIGMTDEHHIGFHLKRAQVASQTLGRSAWHRDRWGRSRGY
jgi:alkylation response protein AidB-like acyl-CoA dehydrogenase